MSADNTDQTPDARRQRAAAIARAGILLEVARRIKADQRSDGAEPTAPQRD